MGTREFTIDRGHGPMPMVAVYVPTNNLYLGDIVICERERASFPNITVEEGIRIFLTGGNQSRQASDVIRVAVRDHEEIEVIRSLLVEDLA